MTRDPSDSAVWYWRAATYDVIGLKEFARSETKIAVRKAGTPLMDTLADDAAQAGLRTFTFTVDPIGFDSSTMLAPATPVEADEGSRVSYIGETGFFATLDRDGGSGPYTITSRVPVPGIGPGQLNVAALRAAGMDYPPEVVALFTGVEPGSLGPNARALEARIVAEAESPAPFDLADQLVTVLHSADYTYDTDVRDLPCSRLSTVERFATYKKGFCQYYATTMAVILRDLGVPTRIAQGFLPGSRVRLGHRAVLIATRTPGWRSISRATAGSSSTRRAAGCRLRLARYRPARLSGVPRRSRPRASRRRKTASGATAAPPRGAPSQSTQEDTLDMGDRANVIDRVDVYGYDLTYAHGDYVMSSGRVVNVLPSTVVRIRTRDGVDGFGEAARSGARTCPPSRKACAPRCASSRRRSSASMRGTSRLSPHGWMRPCVVRSPRRAPWMSRAGTSSAERPASPSRRSLAERSTRRCRCTSPCRSDRPTRWPRSWSVSVPAGSTTSS